MPDGQRPNTAESNDNASRSQHVQHVASQLPNGQRRSTARKLPRRVHHVASQLPDGQRRNTARSNQRQQNSGLRLQVVQDIRNSTSGRIQIGNLATIGIEKRRDALTRVPRGLAHMRRVAVQQSIATSSAPVQKGLPFVAAGKGIGKKEKKAASSLNARREHQGQQAQPHMGHEEQGKALGA